MTSCLPLMLLGSIPMMLQADVNDPAFLKLAEDQRPTSGLSNRESIVDTQPPSKATAAPAYRRFSSFERRAQSATNSFVFSDLGPEKRLSDRKRRAKSVPVDLEFASEHESWVGDKQSRGAKGKGKQRASSFQPNLSSSGATYGPDSISLSELKVAPRRRRSEPLHTNIEYSTAGPSYSSHLRKPESPSSVLPSPQLETLEEEVELKTVDPAITQWTFPWSTPAAALEEESHCIPDIDTSATSSYRSLKRVSFSSRGNEVIPNSDMFTDEISPNQPQSTWANMLFMNAGSGPRPPLKRQNSFPSVRGQAAGRSILKRTSSFNDCTLQENIREAKPNLKLDLPSIPPSSLEQSKRLLDDPAAPKSSPILPCNEKSETSLLCDAVQATVRKAETVVLLPARPRKIKTVVTREPKAVRHWSMDGSNWTRRSEIYASPRMVQNRMPQGPSTPKTTFAERA